MKIKILSVLIASLWCVANVVATDRFVKVDGEKVHVIESGSGSNVVFESGVGEDTQTWGDVAPTISTFAHTFLYDRPGIGQSEMTSRPRDIQQMAEDLHKALSAAQLKPPYILVGHSLGGAIAQVFAHRYPSDIAGLVLCDPEDGRLIDLLRKNLPADLWNARAKAMEQAMPQMSSAQRAELKAATEGGDVVAKAVPLPKVPIVLFTGTQKNPEFPGNPLEQGLKLKLHNELAKSTPGIEHILVPNSRHYIQNDAPQLVIDAVKKIVAGVRAPKAAQ